MVKPLIDKGMLRGFGNYTEFAPSLEVNSVGRSAGATSKGFIIRLTQQFCRISGLQQSSAISIKE